MNDQSPQRAPQGSAEPLDQDAPSRRTAQIVPFERPQSELQKAVQERAQEAMARDRARAKQRPSPWRRGLVLVLAAVPVVLTFGAALAFVGALRQFNTAIFNAAPADAAATPSASTPPDPSASAATPASGAASAPGVVILQEFPAATDRKATIPPPSR